MIVYLCVMSKNSMSLIPEIQGIVNDVYFNDYGTDMIFIKYNDTNKRDFLKYTIEVFRIGRI